MGLPLPPPVPPDPPPPEPPEPPFDGPYGDDCAACFPAGETPLQLYARFSGMSKCPGMGGAPDPPNLKIFVLTQHALAPCVWSGTDGVFDVFWRANWGGGAGHSHLNLRVELWGDYFDTIPGDIDSCTMAFSNQSVCNGGVAATGGAGAVYTTLEAAAAGQAMNIQASDRLNVEVFPVDGDHTVFKYCHKPSSTNIKIKYEH